MKFDTERLRKLPEEFRGPIRTTYMFTLILVKREGSVEFDTTATGKDDLLSKYSKGDLLMMAWTGTYRTDIFVITQEDLDKHYREEKPKIVNKMKAKK